MANTKLAKKTVPAPRRSHPAAGKLAKFQTRALSAARRSREVAGKRKRTLVGMGASLLVGYLEGQGRAPTAFGIMPQALYGVALFAASIKATGAAKEMLEGAADSQLDIALYRVGLGQPIRVEGDWETAGDWESPSGDGW